MAIQSSKRRTASSSSSSPLASWLKNSVLISHSGRNETCCPASLACGGGTGAQMKMELECFASKRNYNQTDDKMLFVKFGGFGCVGINHGKNKVSKSRARTKLTQWDHRGQQRHRRLSVGRNGAPVSWPTHSRRPASRRTCGRAPAPWPPSARPSSAVRSGGSHGANRWAGGGGAASQVLAMSKTSRCLRGD